MHIRCMRCLQEAANKNDFDPTAGSWRRFSKTRVVQLASQIGNNLLGRGYDHIWQGINPDIAFDPAEFFTATDAVPGTVSNLSYHAARTLLGFSSKATDRADVISVPSRSTVPAALSASSAPHFANSGFGDFESEFSMNPVPDPLWPCTLNQAVSDSAVLPNNDLPWWGGFSAEFHLNTVPIPPGYVQEPRLCLALYSLGKTLIHNSNQPSNSSQIPTWQSRKSSFRRVESNLSTS
ncbi:hypothetical protein LTS10_013190 [Elasticomyces elasticus]|nr:hypothetical protein LTS10_013190 [Elasticomyces elasticus]